ncbi:alpha/beta hydrolase [Bdellovibrio sp. HCB337]|uniref:alpha/beta hydrolase n=1 Tax=Bdellovibrio sp. HCB337 TaxID=3394358 RepID=UPI0039A68EB4
MRKLAKVYCLDEYHDDNAPWVILIHGYGADASDLEPLKDYIPTSKKINWLFPQGLIDVPIGPGWTGKAWWSLALSTLPIEDISTTKPDGLEKARRELINMIEELKVPWSKIILGGFSQGAMLATDIYLNAPETPAGLILLSGSLINKEELKPLVEKRKGEKFFQAHGELDQVLHVKGARRLESFLNQGGMKGSCLGFQGGHEIPPQIIQKVGAYIDQQISAKSL